MTILGRPEKAVMREMCGVQLIEKEGTYNLSGLTKFKGYLGWASQGEWSTMAWACFEK